MVRQAGYRRKDLISSEYALLYTYALYLVGKRDFQVPLPDLRNIIAQRFFMVSLTGRYSDSPETRMEQDLADLRGLSTAQDFITHLRRKIDNEFTTDFWNITLPDKLATAAPRSPAFLAYYAALVLLEAKAFFSKYKIADLLDPYIKPKKAALDRHHLFPKAYLDKLGIQDRREVNQVANLAFAEWADNTLVIGDKPPVEYMPQLKKGWEPEEIKQMYFWHVLPDGWETMTYSEFLEERRKRMAQVIRQGFQKLGESIA